MSQTVKNNKHVAISFSIEDADTQQVLEDMKMPMAYIHGNSKRMFEKVEQALEGARIGDQIDVSLSPEEGFGQADPTLILANKLENVPPQFHHIGAEIEFQSDQGDARTFVVTHIGEKDIVIDGNNPLSGKNLVFRVKIEDIRDAGEEEIKTGIPVSRGNQK